MPDGIHSSSDTKVTEIALIEKARAMAPFLEERAHKAEKDRRISTETDREFIDAGFYAALQPRRYGGLELDYGAQTQFAIELSRVCASSGWSIPYIYRTTGSTGVNERGRWPGS